MNDQQQKQTIKSLLDELNKQDKAMQRSMALLLDEIGRVIQSTRKALK